MLQSISLFGTEIELYRPITTLGQLCIFLWIVFNLKEYKAIATISNIPEAKLGGKKNNFFFKWILPFLGIAFIFVTLFALNGPITPKINLLFLGPNTETEENFFYNILILPIGLILSGILVKLSPLKFTDYIAPAISLALILFKIACACAGCCYGIPSQTFGIMNHSNGMNEKQVPIQLIEAFCALVMFVIILLIRRKKDRTSGLLYPIFMLMYCGSRFVSEFWRGDFPAVWGPLKGYHIQCIVGFVEGLIFLFVVLKWGERITEYYRLKRESILAKYQEKAKAKSKKKK